MPKVTIDGKEFEAPAGKTVIQVALDHGIEIPHFCWHPALTVAGNCRMCLVEIEKQPKLAIACSTQIADGMVVKTVSENALKGREDVMEFLLVNHPLDCPICDEAGQCKLQDYAFTHSRAESRFREEKNHKDKRTPLGPNVLFDAERCISCSRCIRFSSEIAHQPVLTFVQRGDHVTIEATPAEGFDNNYSMNVIDICPVGALTSRDFRFKSRVWDMSFTPSVCTGCARGCSIRVGVRNNEIMRLEPRPNPNVNDYWMCDHGRLASYPDVNSDTRLSGCKARSEDEQKVITWDEAVRITADNLKKFNQHEVLFIGSAKAPVEDNYLFAKLARAKFGMKEISFIPHFESKDEALLLRADRTPNAAGATLAGVISDEHYAHAEGEKRAKQTILEQLKSGTIKAVYALEDDFLSDPELLRAFRGVKFFACHSTNDSATSRRADVVFAASAWAEREGTVVNFNGWVQKLVPAITTTQMVRGRDNMRMSRLDRFGSPNDRWANGNKRDAMESWRIVQDLAAALGTRWHYLHTEDVFHELAGAIPEFAGMSYESIGELGAPLAGEHRELKHALYHEIFQSQELHSSHLVEIDSTL